MGTALLTDLYELTMAQSYLEHNKTGSAVFSIFPRTLPVKRNFLVAGGLETLIGQLEQFRFSGEDIVYLKSLQMFSDDFLSWLRDYRFSGTLSAIPEGSIVFQNEPLVQVEGPLPDVQILETLALNCIHFETVAASKAARIVSVSRGRSIVEFGFRRSHTPAAGIAAARAAYIAGFAGTSDLEAGKRYGIPVVGTMAHSYVMLFDTEDAAFRAYQSSFPERGLYLIDTYDTLACAETVIRLARDGVPAIGIRIDSGDIGALATQVRSMFDRAGLSHIKIFVSNNVDEYSIDRWLAGGVPIDSFGVGTHFITSSDAPYLDMVYKLVEYEGTPRYKTSPGKTTFPYRRQVVRHYRDGIMDHDEVIRMAGCEDDGLVEPYLRDGKLTRPLPSVEDIRKHCAHELTTLPGPFRTLAKQEYGVNVLP
ncbi:MAG: nicotinate phosphoribosyltransferase [Methanoregula sp.]|jgi:nicotinate phosphoribosyltransferase|uniref:nicotinate phosphoribosyltransferase n=1 Tax=Methanoregula sp. TaxID=2052170 RepID=UPI0025E7E898|nr:nicotinate phosphoribosyltransferase [Methanoregula sp.]MCK9631381.1 nicotinate phosphoribosyltransferase [Methanoregula sp.]